MLESAQKMSNFNISLDEFGWEMAKLLWKDFEKLLLSKKLFYFQTSINNSFKKIKFAIMQIMNKIKKNFWKTHTEFINS